MMRENTAKMTTREIADYLAKQQARRWPGSRSIKPRNWAAKPVTRREEAPTQPL